jgi:succinate dehydrogenase/fumarate reductase flavoprotein subunit
MKKILISQLDYIVHKSNWERAHRDLQTLRRRSTTTEEELERARTRVQELKERYQEALKNIDRLGDSKSSIG